MVRTYRVNHNANINKQPKAYPLFSGKDFIGRVNPLIRILILSVSNPYFLSDINRPVSIRL